MSSRIGRAVTRSVSLATVASVLALLVASCFASGLTARAQTATPAVQPGQPVAPAAPASVDTASYDLAARWDPTANQIDGTATITYRNHSADTLGEIWLKLYLNAFRSEDTQWMREASGAHRENSYDPMQPGWIHLERLRLADTGEDL